MERNLVLTVGMGSGKNPTIVNGLIRTLQLVNPDRYWLVPSSSQASRDTADKVREAIPSSFTEWSKETLYYEIVHPENLFECRSALREVIKVAAKFSGDLILNPTSGTKQMSVGATLAALDEGIGRIEFIAGEWQNGLVLAGTERLEGFTTAEIFRERALHDADMLYKRGAFNGALQLLDEWSYDDRTERAMQIATCAYEWHRFNYSRAADAASFFNSGLEQHLKTLHNNTTNNIPSVLVLNDLLAGAEDLRSWGDLEEAVIRFYKAFEYACHLRLCQKFNATLPFKASHFKGIKLQTPLREKPHIGISLSIDILRKKNDSFAKTAYRGSLQKLLEKRNRTIHQFRPITQREASDLREEIMTALNPFYSAATTKRSITRPESLLP